MNSWTFTCPGCGSMLRLREGQLAGRILDCPDCAAPLKIRRNAQDEWQAEQVDGGKIEESPETPESSATQPLLTQSHDQRAPALNPARISWTVALVVASVAAIFLLRPQSDEVDRANVDAETPENEAPVPQIVEAESDEIPAAATSDQEGSDPTVDAIHHQPGTDIAAADWPTATDVGIDPDTTSRPASDTTQEAAGDTDVEFDARQGADTTPTALEQPSPLQWLGEAAARLWYEPLLDAETSAALNQARIATQQPETPPVDIPERLAQQLLLFEQREPSPLSRQLAQLEELLGVPIVLAESHQDQLTPLLDTPVTYSLKECRVEEVLELLLSKVGCVYEVGEGLIEVRPAGM